MYIWHHKVQVNHCPSSHVQDHIKLKCVDHLIELFWIRWASQSKRFEKSPLKIQLTEFTEIKKDYQILPTQKLLINRQRHHQRTVNLLKQIQSILISRKRNQESHRWACSSIKNQLVELSIRFWVWPRRRLDRFLDQNKHHSGQGVSWRSYVLQPRLGIEYWDLCSQWCVDTAV